MTAAASAQEKLVSHGRWMMLAGSVVLTTATGCKSSSTSPAADWPAHRAALEDSLRSFADTVLAAESSLDPARAAGLNDDVEPPFTVVGQQEYHLSRDSLRIGLTAAYAQIDSNVQVFDRIRVRAFTPDLATVVMHGRSRVYPKGGGLVRERSTGTFVLVRRPGGWRIAQSHITAVPDSAP